MILKKVIYKKNPKSKITWPLFAILKKISFTFVFNAIICFEEYLFPIHDYIFELLVRRATRVVYIEVDYITNWAKIN